MKNKEWEEIIKEILSDMIKKYLQDGKSLNRFLRQNYIVAKEYGQNKTEMLWAKIKEEME